jgi:ABC-type branched-subunit amino acid transport system substrate-binding protein
MRPTPVRIGVLFSTTGSYAAVGRAMHAGALLAIDEINADPGRAVELTAVEADPGGVNAAYAAAVQHLTRHEGLSHVVGCYTSSSRKEVLPLFGVRQGSCRLRSVHAACRSGPVMGPPPPAFCGSAAAAP